MPGEITNSRALSITAQSFDPYSRQRVRQRELWTVPEPILHKGPHIKATRHGLKKLSISGVRQHFWADFEINHVARVLILITP
jgi:hypothetical protein